MTTRAEVEAEFAAEECNETMIRLDPEKEQRQLLEKVRLEHSMRQSVRQDFLYYAPLNQIPPEEQTKILQTLSEHPMQTQLEYIIKLKARAEALAKRDALQAEHAALVRRHAAALEHQVATAEGVVDAGDTDED